jgi:DNA-binding transcriptional ArsR family regulator
MNEQTVTSVFAALGDPTRRRIVELLSDGRALRLSDLVEEFDVSRQTVTKHLNVLCGAGLANTKWRGRERYTTLSEDALDPIRRWLDHYDRFWSARLEALKREIERRDMKWQPSEKK